jgi:tyrosyl-tRNA synthetase
LAIPEAAVREGKVWVVALLADAGLVGSRGEARRLVSQGAVRLDGQQVGSIEQSWPPAELHGRLLTVGRRSPVLLQAPGS